MQGSDGVRGSVPVETVQKGELVEDVFHFGVFLFHSHHHRLHQLDELKRGVGLAEVFDLFRCEERLQ